MTLNFLFPFPFNPAVKIGCAGARKGDFTFPTGGLNKMLEYSETVE